VSQVVKITDIFHKVFTQATFVEWRTKQVDKPIGLFLWTG